MVDAEYDIHVKSLKPEEKPKTRIQLQTEISRREYEKESEDVKAEIEKARNELIAKTAKTTDSKSTEERNEKYQ